MPEEELTAYRKRNARAQRKADADMSDALKEEIQRAVDACKAQGGDCSSIRVCVGGICRKIAI